MKIQVYLDNRVLHMHYVGSFESPVVPTKGSFLNLNKIEYRVDFAEFKVNPKTKKLTVSLVVM